MERKEHIISLLVKNEPDVLARIAGALGGKLLGAGGAGLILFYCPKERQDAFRARMKGMNEMSFHFDDFGSKIIYVGDKFSD